MSVETITEILKTLAPDIAGAVALAILILKTIRDLSKLVKDLYDTVSSVKKSNDDIQASRNEELSLIKAKLASIEKYLLNERDKK